MTPRTWKVGDVVRWKSQAAGRWKTKIGIVVEVVPPKAYPAKDGPTRGGYYGARDHQWYVVKVDKIFYYPRAASLRPVKP